MNDDPPNPHNNHFHHLCRREAASSSWTKRKLVLATRVAHYINPLVAIIFMVIYWIFGMYENLNPEVQG